MMMFRLRVCETHTTNFGLGASLLFSTGRMVLSLLYNRRITSVLMNDRHCGKFFSDYIAAVQNGSRIYF